jgi:hypothetical protein
VSDGRKEIQISRERENWKKRKMKRAREIENSTERQTGRDRE